MTHLNNFSYTSAGIQQPTWLSFDQDYMLNMHNPTTCFTYSSHSQTQYFSIYLMTLKARDVQNRFFLFQFGFGSVFEKNSDSVLNEFG